MSRIRKYLHSLFLSLFPTYSVIAVSATAYAQSCSCEVSDRKERVYDELLKVDADEKENAIEGFKATSLWPKEGSEYCFLEREMSIC